MRPVWKLDKNISDILRLVVDGLDGINFRSLLLFLLDFFHFLFKFLNLLCFVCGSLGISVQDKTSFFLLLGNVDLRFFFNNLLEWLGRTSLNHFRSLLYPLLLSLFSSCISFHD